jgi:hypothetical protein
MKLAQIMLQNCSHLSRNREISRYVPGTEDHVILLYAKQRITVRAVHCSPHPGAVIHMESEDFHNSVSSVSTILPPGLT